MTGKFKVQLGSRLKTKEKAAFPLFKIPQKQAASLSKLMKCESYQEELPMTYTHWTKLYKVKKKIMLRKYAELYWEYKGTLLVFPYKLKDRKV